MLVRGRIDALHFDVMDGLFVPRLGLYPELLKAIKNTSKLPVDVHLMIENPEQFIGVFAEAGADIIVVHAESTHHLHRTIKAIRDAGASAGVALNPATPLSVLDYVLDNIDLVMLMAINPGIVGHKLIPETMGKIQDLRAKLAGRPMTIEVDGGVSPASAADMVRSGADLLVCGTSSIYKGGDLARHIRAFRARIDADLSVRP